MTDSLFKIGDKVYIDGEGLDIFTVESSEYKKPYGWLYEVKENNEFYLEDELEKV